MPKQTLKGPEGLIIKLDSDQIFPDDPGQGTPAMVIQRKQGRDEFSATYNCAASEYVLEGDRDTFLVLNRRKCEWLDAQLDVVERFITEHLRAQKPAQMSSGHVSGE